ncbi:acyltransferase family protein [Granulicella arctica]|uniref:acyltransferase family protein n=1 Tax=Granulicella arctica TaxID=940613 RepID=UPI0021E0BA20|nr:acyltransferase [Granulicella arctica]
MERVLTPPLEPITAPVRSTIVDIVKGLAITLVVFGHTAQGMYHRRWWTGRSMHLFDLFIYSFHMPIFFFVAGLFLTGSLQRRGPANFILDRSKTILYPYVLWVVVSASIEPLISHFKIGYHPFEWKAFLVNLVDGELSWFLPVLFCCQLLALCTFRTPKWIRLGIALAAALVVRKYGLSVFYKTVHEFCYLAAGMAIGRMILKLELLPAWAAAAGALLIFAVQMDVILHSGSGTYLGGLHHRLAVILGFTGTAGLLLLARSLDGTRFADMWIWLGKASLGIFLLSSFAQGATRELILRIAHTHELWLQLCLPSIVALILSAIVWHQQERWRIGWLFHWPSI